MPCSWALVTGSLMSLASIGCGSWSFTELKIAGRVGSRLCDAARSHGGDGAELAQVGMIWFRMAMAMFSGGSYADLTGQLASSPRCASTTASSAQPRGCGTRA